LGPFLLFGRPRTLMQLVQVQFESTNDASHFAASFLGCRVAACTPFYRWPAGHYTDPDRKSCRICFFAELASCRREHVPLERVLLFTQFPEKWRLVFELDLDALLECRTNRAGRAMSSEYAYLAAMRRHLQSTDYTIAGKKRKRPR
jgi:hypothetical protein